MMNTPFENDRGDEYYNGEHSLYNDRSDDYYNNEHSL